MADNDWQDGICLKASLPSPFGNRVWESLGCIVVIPNFRTDRQHLSLPFPRGKQHLHYRRAEGER